MSAPVFRHAHRVSYSECTLGNHVYYARYLDILEAARAELFRELGATFVQWQQQDVIFPVVECQLRYRAPARYDDWLTTELWLTSLERVRMDFAYRITVDENKLILEATTQHVCTGLNEKPKRLPEDLATKLRTYVRA
jgi:acyl-CoA thioester hydrolase